MRICDIIAAPVGPFERIASNMVTTRGRTLAWSVETGQSMVTSRDWEDMRSLGRLPDAWNGPVNGLCDGDSKVDDLKGLAASASDMVIVRARGNGNSLGSSGDHARGSSQGEREGECTSRRSDEFR